MILVPEEFLRLYDLTTCFIKQECEQRDIKWTLIRSRRKNGLIPLVRKKVAKRLKETYPELSTVNIGKLLNVDHSTIVGYLKK